MSSIVEALRKAQDIAASRPPVTAPARTVEASPAHRMAPGVWMVIGATVAGAVIAVYFWPEISARLPARLLAAPAERALVPAPDAPVEPVPAPPVSTVGAALSKGQSAAITAEFYAVPVLAIMEGNKPRVLTKNGPVQVGEAISPNLTLIGVEEQTMIAADKAGVIYRRGF